MMSRCFLFILILVLPVTVVLAQTKKVSVLDGKATIELPSEYLPASKEEAAHRYQQVVPTESYKSKDGRVVLAFLGHRGKKNTEELLALKETLIEEYRKAKDRKFISAEEKTINSHKYIVILFYSGKTAFDVYNCLLLGSVAGEAMIFSVTVPLSSYDQYKSDIDKAIASFRVKG